MTVLKIQPGSADGYDTFINEADPTVNYKSDVLLLARSLSPGRMQSLLQFSLSALPEGATISKAEFCIYCTGVTDSPNVYCHEVSQAWYVDTVDWISRPIPGMPGIAGIAVVNTWLKFDVFDIVQDWIANPSYNLGFQLLTDLCEDSYISFHSSDYVDDPTLRPYLEITYIGGAVSGCPTTLIVTDKKANGTNGGDFSTGAWRTRVLNTIDYNGIGGASLASNRITLPAGTYLIEASAPAFGVTRHKIKLRDITNSIDTIIGSSEYAYYTYNGANRSHLIGSFIILTATVFEIQHYCEVSVNTYGFGVASSFGVVEVYTQVKITRIA